jgi:hypothetical protein
VEPQQPLQGPQTPRSRGRPFCKRVRHPQRSRFLIYSDHQTPPSHSTNDHWTPLSKNDSPGSYARAIEKFFLVTLRSLKGHPSDYEIPLTPPQKQAALSLFEALRLQEEGVLQHFHRLSWSLLVHQPETADVTVWSCPLLCYFAVLALHNDGNFMSPDEYSGHGAKFKYWSNTAAIFEADLRSATHPQGMIG